MTIKHKIVDNKLLFDVEGMTTRDALLWARMLRSLMENEQMQSLQSKVACDLITLMAALEPALEEGRFCDLGFSAEQENKLEFTLMIKEHMDGVKVFNQTVAETLPSEDAEPTP